MADDDFGIDEGHGDERIDGIDDPDGYAVAMAAGELSLISNGAKVLKGAAALATALWLLAVITVFWNWWELSENDSSGGIVTGSMQNTRILQVLSTTLSSTWGYAIVAVLAYIGAMVLHSQRMRLLVAAAGDDD